MHLVQWLAGWFKEMCVFILPTDRHQYVKSTLHSRHIYIYWKGLRAHIYGVTIPELKKTTLKDV